VRMPGNWIGTAGHSVYNTRNGSTWRVPDNPAACVHRHLCSVTYLPGTSCVRMGSSKHDLIMTASCKLAARTSMLLHKMLNQRCAVFFGGVQVYCPRKSWT
jgi:hypothetical protein